MGSFYAPSVNQIHHACIRTLRFREIHVYVRCPETYPIIRATLVAAAAAVVGSYLDGFRPFDAKIREEYVSAADARALVFELSAKKMRCESVW